MKSSKWKLGTLAAAVVAASAFVSQAQAAFISLNPTPASPTMVANQPVSVDIVVNGLPAAAGGFSLLLDYGNLTYGSYTLGAGWGAAFDISPGDLGGAVQFVVGDGNPNEAAAYFAQGSGGNFTLATVNFTGPATPGDFTLGLRAVAISDYNGFSLLACTGAGCIGQAAPEPTTPLLVAAALAALALSRKKPRQQQPQPA